MQAVDLITAKNLDNASRAFVDNDFSDVIFSFTRTASGKLVVLSRFDDDIWIIPDSYFPRHVTQSSKRIEFKKIPVQFRIIMKACILKLFLFGLPGRILPRGNTLVQFYVGCISFLSSVTAHCGKLSEITPILFQNYIYDCKKIKGRKFDTLSVDALRLRLVAIETLHLLSQNTFDSMCHPWPDSSSATLAGKNGNQWYLSGKTPIIPDAELSELFKSAVEDLAAVDHLLDLREGCYQIQRRISCNNNLSLYTTPYLLNRGYTGGRRRLNEDLKRSYIACMIIIFTTSGIRISELCSLDESCSFETTDEDGNSIYWMRGVSEKTKEGKTEWVVTKITHEALQAAAKITKPLREKLANKIDLIFSADPESTEALSMNAHRHAIFLVEYTKTGSINTISGVYLSGLLEYYRKSIGVKWKFSTHQFRRTFAVYVVRSANGDIRYLKEHFKHWTLDMTALYAAHEERDSELLDELMTAFFEAKHEAVEHILDESTSLSGGLADDLKQFRAKPHIYASRKEMVKTVSETVFIRATGVAWCTNDLGDCIGGTGIEVTRCADCSNSIIDDTQQPIWQNLYDQQHELLKLTDIGEGGVLRVQRDLDRCAKVLSDLGVSLQGGL